MEKEYSLEAKKPMPRHFSSLSSVLQLVCIADCETVSKAFTTVSIVSEALFIYDMTSALADSKMLMAKIHSYLKQCLCNFHFIKTRYFSQNISISWSIQAPGSHEWAEAHVTIQVIRILHFKVLITNMPHFFTKKEILFVNIESWHFVRFHKNNWC